jgi:tetratricopeptide (TPR) repeat protein
MKCPVCRARYTASSSPLCRRCGADLTALIRLHDQAVEFHRRAIQAFQARDYSSARQWNQRAIALHHHQADFHALAGQLWALQGQLEPAISAWQTAIHLHPQHPTATALLHCLGQAKR